MTVIRSTYRVQLHAGFDFEALSEIVDYLAELGVSHIYLSPVLQARKGSAHGYDVVNPKEVNPELGGIEGFRRLQSRAHEAGMGLIVDIVPNHMAVAGRENRWWWDVLENGPASRYAHYFDISWENPDPRFGQKILLPVLGNHYGRVLKAGELTAARRGPEFYIEYFDHEFPVAPESLAGIFEEAARRSGNDGLHFLADMLRVMPSPLTTDKQDIERRHRMKSQLGALLSRMLDSQASPEGVLDETITELNQDAERLHDFLERQNYRLSYWRAASRDLGYRRFFDVNDLIALRMEDPQVFEETHELVLAWLRSGAIDGLRIDHPDGLHNPREYFERLRARSPGAWIVVEKILHRGEQLPPDWSVDGTTGYEFLNDAAELLVDPEGEEPLTRLYESLTGESQTLAEEQYEKKYMAVRDLLGSDLERLAEQLTEICAARREFRDFTREDLREAITEFAVALPVYRTYIEAGEGRCRTEDRHIIENAAAWVSERRPDLDEDLVTFVRDLLLLRHTGPLEGEFVMRFQQFAGPVMAKGVEDTAFYTWLRFPALNEVGGDPSLFGITPEEFHRGQEKHMRAHPRAMLTTSTHDTKRSEDVRARLAVLSEIPDRWEEAVRRWMGAVRKKRRAGNLDPKTLYLLFQTAIGAWPIDEERLHDYMLKATREGKEKTTWTRPDEAFEAALDKTIKRLFADKALLAEIGAFRDSIASAANSNALAQLTLKLTCPGVPDIYQGTELWNLSLVDPDNRRPVDYKQRRNLLKDIREGRSGLSEGWEDGLPKMLVLHRLLKLRAARPECFKAEAGYTPLSAEGSHADCLLAFGRGPGVLVFVQRLTMRLAGGWGDTKVHAPEGTWREVFSGRTIKGGDISPGAFFEHFPVAVFESAGEAVSSQEEKAT